MTSQAATAVRMDEAAASKSPHDPFKLGTPKNIEQRRIIEVSERGTAVKIDAAEDDVAGVEYSEVVSHSKAVSMTGLDETVVREGVPPVGKKVGFDEYLRTDLDHVPAVYSYPLYSLRQLCTVARAELEAIVNELGPLEHGLSECFAGTEKVGDPEILSHSPSEPGGHDADFERGWGRPLRARCEQIQQTALVLLKIRTCASCGMKALRVGALQRDVDLVKVSLRQRFDGIGSEQRSIGGKPDLDTLVMSVIEDLKEMGMEHGLAHNMERDFVGEVQLANLVKSRPGKRFVHYAPFASHPAVRAEQARKVAPVGKLEMNPLKFSREIGRYQFAHHSFTLLQGQ
jgi:hypothetical protein